MTVSLLGLQDVEFRFRDSSGRRVARIANLSAVRARLAIDDSKPWPSVGSEFEAEVVFNWATHALRAKIERQSVSAVELLLMGERSGLTQSLSRYFGSDHEAREIHETPPEVLERSPIGDLHVLTGQKDFELTLVLNSNLKILKFHLSARGHFLEGGRDLPTVWGKPEKAVVNEKPSHKGSELVDLHGRPDSAIVEAIVETIGKIRQLTMNQVTQLQSLIRSS